MQAIGAHCCEVMYFGCFGFRGELGFLNCDDIRMSSPLNENLVSAFYHFTGEAKKILNPYECHNIIFVNIEYILCVVNKQFELLEFVFDSVYVDLQYDEISLTFTAGSVCCL